MNIVLKNELYDIKNKYLGFIEQERKLRSEYEEGILEKLHIDTRRNDEYYNLLEIQRELYRNNNSIDSEKTKFVERKHNKRLFLTGMTFYLIPSCVGFILSSFVSFPSIIVPLVSMISCISASGFDCIINHKKCFRKYSKCFEDFDSTKKARLEIERLKNRECELQTKLNETTLKQNDIHKKVESLEKELNLLNETINLFRINSFEKILGCQKKEQDIELKLSK